MFIKLDDKEQIYQIENASFLTSPTWRGVTDIETMPETRITTYRDEDFILREDLLSDYNTILYTNNILMLSNEVNPQVL